MMRTLHSYLGKELLKTFMMTTVALTILLVMGGGVANLVRGEGIGAEALAKVFAFLTPVAVTLILPIAALFSGTITFGRAATDNEIIACRAAGINIHRLLLTPILLGFTVTVITYWSWNHLIPGLSQQIVELTRRDLPTIVMNELARAKALSFGKYRIRAGRCDLLAPEALPAGVPDGHTFMLLSAVSFVEMEDQEIFRFGTADATVIDFDNSRAAPLVTVDLQGVRTFDALRRQYYELKHQTLGPIEVPLPMKRKLKFENLAKLREYRRHPENMPDLEGRINGLRRAMLAYFAYSDLVTHLDPANASHGPYRLTRPDMTYEITCDKYATDPESGKPTLAGVHIRETRKTPSGGDEIRRLNADTARLGMRSTFDPDKPELIVELSGNVEIHRGEPLTSPREVKRSISHDDERVVRKTAESLLPVDFMSQPSLRAKASTIDVAALLDRSKPFDLPPDQAKMREKLIFRSKQLESELIGEIHFRSSYALSTMAVVALGAILGIIVRGGQVLTAFGISCVPSLFVVLTSIIGRNFAGRPEYTDLSVATMWGGTAGIYLATLFVAFKLLRR
jgi:lipopolysaccharide export LptBFGC system permease protein LptF